MSSYYGKKEWTCQHNPKLYTTLWRGRRFLYLGSKKIAEQYGVKGDAEKWAQKKAQERFKSTGNYYTKVKKQLDEISSDNATWCDICDDLG